MRRLLVVAGVIVAAGIGAVLSASAADAADLEDYLRGAADAEFAGRQVVVTHWDGATSGGIYQVAQTGGTTFIGDGIDEVMAGNGMIETKSADRYDQRGVGSWSGWTLGDRYAMESPESVTRLGRPATALVVTEEGRQRMRIVIDDETGAPLLTEVYGSGGDLYRLSVIVEFTPRPPVLRLEASGMGDGDMAAEASGLPGLPAHLDAYRRVDAYTGPEGTTHGFYSDGLFSFSVFVAERKAAVGHFADADKVRIGGRTYRRILDPGGVRVFWRTPNATYVLVGGLPPDHLQEVLGGLPEPGRPGLFTRVWRGLFG